ncbi:MAG: metalloregulator ArsR/SmtB family transcription factor [Pseudomonadota bacterium]
MPSRAIIAKELSQILKTISHPDRVRIIEELRGDEKDVNTIAAALELTSTRISQHLSLMKAHRIVDERREGRHHYYHLVQPEIADWIVNGLAFVEGRMSAISAAEIKSARKLWGAVPVQK